MRLTRRGQYVVTGLILTVILVSMGLVGYIETL